MSDHAIRSAANSSGSFVKMLANIFSWLFHPMFIATYVMYFLAFVHPYAFTGASYFSKVQKVITVFFSTALLPAFAVFLMWKLKLVLHSIYLKTSRERIIPYVIAMIFYWWAWHVFANLSDCPPATVAFLLGCFLAICGVWFANIYFKISMHAAAMGGLVAFMVLFSFSDLNASRVYLSIAVLIAGIVCTSRFLVSDHSSLDIYAGVAVGAVAQIVAWNI